MVSVSKKICAVCPDCEQPFELERLPVRDVIIICPNCETELEVISVDPLQLDFYYEGDWKACESSNW
jgi:lysine biosynthesis protein LysW